MQDRRIAYLYKLKFLWVFRWMSRDGTWWELSDLDRHYLEDFAREKGLVVHYGLPDDQNGVRCYSWSVESKGSRKMRS